MRMNLSDDWDLVVRTEQYLDVKAAGSDEVRGKCKGSPFSIKGHQQLILHILSILREPQSVRSLAREVMLPPNVLTPLVAELVKEELLVVHEEPTPIDSPYIQSLVIIGNRLFAAELLRMLGYLKVTVPAIALENLSLRQVGALARLEQALQESDRPMLVGAPVVGGLGDLLSINSLCLQTQSPWLPVYFDGSMVRLGPVVIPYKTACFGCLTVRLDADASILFPEFTGGEEYLHLQEIWPCPEKGLVALDLVRTIPECIREIEALVTGSTLPALIGCQHTMRRDDAGPVAAEKLTFEPNSRCPSCYCGTSRRPRRFHGKAPDLSILRQITETGKEAVYNDGGHRTKDAMTARRMIADAFAPFGPTFRVVRANHGPLGALPSYRSYSSGYLSRDLPYIIPQKEHSGKGISEEQGFLSAAFEMAERVSAAFHGQLELVQARPSEVRGLSLDIATCVGTRYLDLPGLDCWEDDVLTDWVWAQSLITGKPLLVPASMVFFPQPRFRGIFKAQWTGGLAAGAALQDAVLQGLLERVEHDGWAVWQLNRISCPTVETASIEDPEVLHWLQEIRAKGFEVIIRDRRTELEIPTFRVWIVNRGVPRAFACRGDGANLDPLVALKRALTEAQHKIVFADQAEWRQVLSRPSTKLFEEERSLYYLSGLAPFELLNDGVPVKFQSIKGYSCHDVAKDIGTVVRLIAENIPGAEVAVVDLTDPFLKIPVVRVITSGLQEMAKPWSHVLRRTFDLPVQLGYRSAPLSYTELYHGIFPH